MNFGFTSGKKKTAPTKKWTDKEIEAKVVEFDKKIQEAKDREGDVEVRDAHLDKAEWLKNEARDFPHAERVYREAYDLSGGASRKMEILFDII